MPATMTRPKAPPRPGAPQRSAAPAAKTSVSFAPISDSHGQKIGLYGPGGIGKTTLAACAPGPVAFADLDESLPILRDQLDGLDVRTVAGVSTWTDLRGALQGSGWDGIGSVVIDTGTRAEELALAHMLATVPHEKGNRVQRIDDYGYGKGYTHLFETFLTLLGDLDQHVKAGRNVVLVMHDCTSNVPNPMGDDWIRYEPRLSSPASGKASIRLRVREWLDHLLFVGYDVSVNKGGKASGSGTRTIYPVEMPWCMAKSRRLDTEIPLVRGDTAVWDRIFGTGKGE